eukprot:365122-Chlamydomonas_euryale.AAC.31
MVRRRTLQRMGHVLRMDEHRLPRQLPNLGCHEEGSDGGTTFWDFLKLPGHTKLIPWPEIQAAEAECALDRQAWRDAFKNLALLEFKKPQQAGRMIQSCARLCGSG